MATKPRLWFLLSLLLPVSILCQAPIGIEKPCGDGEDNLSCPTDPNNMPLQCFPRTELCNSVTFCGSDAADEGFSVFALDCECCIVRITLRYYLSAPVNHGLICISFGRRWRSHGVEYTDVRMHWHSKPKRAAGRDL